MHATAMSLVLISSYCPLPAIAIAPACPSPHRIHSSARLLVLLCPALDRATTLIAAIEAHAASWSLLYPAVDSAKNCRFCASADAEDISTIALLLLSLVLVLAEILAAVQKALAALLLLQHHAPVLLSSCALHASAAAKDTSTITIMQYAMHGFHSDSLLTISY